MFYFLVIAALLVASTAEPIFPHGRIIGGEDTVIETYPYQISLQAYGSHICGGSIIDSNWIVTAGHCVETPASLMSIRAGTSIRGRGGSVHKIDKIIRHEKYNVNEYGIPTNDIAIIHVKDGFTFDDTRQPIRLFEIDEESKAGVKSVITGWGNTGFGLASQLQTVSIPIIDKSLCHDAYKSYGGLPAGQICAAFYGVGGKDACQGDSGGPLAIDGRLAGIVSWGNGCAKPKYPGAYTEVAAFRQWVDEKLNHFNSV